MLVHTVRATAWHVRGSASVIMMGVASVRDEHRVSEVLFVTLRGRNWEARPVHARELQLKLGLRLLHEEFLAPCLPQQTLEVGSPGLPGR